MLEPVQEQPDEWTSPLSEWFDNLVQPMYAYDDMREQDFEYEGRMLDEEDRLYE